MERAAEWFTTWKAKKMEYINLDGVSKNILEVDPLQEDTAYYLCSISKKNL